MPIRITLTLGLGLAIAGSALADTTYKIRPGDTIEVIAKKFHVRQGSLQSANGVHANTVLRVGRTIIVPGTVAKLDHKASPKVSKSSGGYVVRNGDQDWTLAEKLGITLKQLHQLNPGLNWSRLQIGQHLNVPGASHHAVASNDPAPKAGGSYTIQEGDNDWLIARRYDTTPKIIRQLNPDVHWDHVQIGHHIRVPSAQKVARASKPQFNSRYAVLTGDNVMIRRRPSIGSEAVAKVQAGTRVTVLDRDSGWYRLRFPYGTEGWVRGDYLHAAAPPARSHRVAIEKPRAKATRIARSEPASGSYSEEIVAAQEKGGTVDKIINRAKSLRGVRYRWGQASRSGTDCSGLTTQCFKSNGITLPRTSAEQSKVGVPVARNELQRGDLVFFRTVRGTRVSHVGIYLGNGNFIHASSGRGHVTESSLSDPYYNARYVTARRLVKGKKHFPKDLVQELPNLPSLGDISDPDPVAMPSKTGGDSK